MGADPGLAVLLTFRLTLAGISERVAHENDLQPKTTEHVAPSPTHIAILDDEADITSLLAGYLQRHGYRVSQAHDGGALMHLMADDPPALVLLDIGLPGEDGFTIARQLRERSGWRGGLVIVSGLGDAVDKVVGLEVGADDYITKPFDLRELLARVKAVLRRTLPGAEFEPLAASAHAAPAAMPAAGVRTERYKVEGWTIDLAARQVENEEGEGVPLTSGEFDLLATFVRHPGRVLSRDFLLEATRGRESSPFDRTIDVQIGRLRRKLGDDPADPRLIKSVRGAGYLFTAVPAAA